MLNSKYSKVLTIILVVAIIVIIGLLVFVGLDWYKAMKTEKDNNDFMGQFNSYIENVPQIEENTTNEVISGNETINNDNIIEEPGENNTNTEENNNNNNNSTGNNNGLNYKGYKVAGIIEIPKTNVKYNILNDSSANAMDVGITILYGPGINEVGNTVLAGHNYRNGTFFSNNKKLSKGDKIYLTDLKGKKVEYTITHTYKTDASDFSYATRDTKGKRAISLTTCTDDSSARIIIWAEEK